MKKPHSINHQVRIKLVFALKLFALKKKSWYFHIDIDINYFVFLTLTQWTNKNHNNSYCSNNVLPYTYFLLCFIFCFSSIFVVPNSVNCQHHHHHNLIKLKYISTVLMTWSLMFSFWLLSVCKIVAVQTREEEKNIAWHEMYI